MKIAVCDDNRAWLSDAKSKLESAWKSLDLIIYTFESGRELLKSMTDVTYDLIILDIEMPEADGLSVASEIRKSGSKAALVFLTSHIEYAVKGYEVNALRYLTKPVKESQLSEIISYLITQSSDTKKIMARCGEETVFVSISDILYLEAQNQDIKIVTADRTYFRRYNIKDYEKELKEYFFIRCHRSYIVNIAHAAGVSPKEIRLDSGETIPLSRNREKEVREALISWNIRSSI